MSNPPTDPLKEKFRPNVDTDLDREINEAMAGLSIEQLEGKDAPAPAHDSVAAELAAKGIRRGRIVSIRKGDVMVDRYDPSEGLVVLSRRGAGAIQHTVNWENIDVGTLVEGVVTGMNKGGLELQIKSMRAFMPAGQVNLFFEKDISVY